ncbi:DUF6300 family protein [Streptomyces sp. NPDC091217]|uniref:DUF6300 family protein n=1 Tax=Streptomyces sp. NPDC091217 TaxID=3365975 RepID=UPI00381F86C3
MRQLSDEDLTRLRSHGRDDKEKTARPCSRCGTELLLYWHGPLGTAVWMELCPACDEHRPAARALTHWLRDANRDPAVLPQLFEDWETETMHAHGWARAQEPEAPPSPLPHPASDRADEAGHDMTHLRAVVVSFTP